MPNHRPLDPISRFALVSRLDGSCLEIAVAGELDMATTFKLEPDLDRLLDEPPVRRLVLDLSEVSFVDSAGLGLLLSIRERARDLGIEMRFARPSDPVRRILGVSGSRDVLREAEVQYRHAVHGVAD